MTISRRHSEYFARLEGECNIELLHDSRITIVGVGSVGSHAAVKLANNAVGFHRYIEGKNLQRHNLFRHALKSEWIDINKAVALQVHLMNEIPDFKAEAIERHVDESMTDDELDSYLDDVDLVIIATDVAQVQRRIAARAHQLGTIALVPTLHGEGFDVFTQFGTQRPCYMCADGFHNATEPSRPVNANATPVDKVSTELQELACGLLDPSSDTAGLTRPDTRGGQSLQLSLGRGDQVRRIPIPWRRNCSMCGGPPELTARAVARNPSPPRTTSPPSLSVSPHQIDWTLRGNELSANPALITITNQGGAYSSPPTVRSSRNTGTYWRLQKLPTDPVAIATYEVTALPAARSMSRGPHAEQVTISVDGQAISIPIVLTVAAPEPIEWWFVYLCLAVCLIALLPGALIAVYGPLLGTSLHPARSHGAHNLASLVGEAGFAAAVVGLVDLGLLRVLGLLGAAVCGFTLGTMLWASVLGLHYHGL